MIELISGEARAVIDPQHGGRVRSLEVGRHSLLVDDGDDPLRWGCYPMVPWAGRVADGHFRFGGVDHHLPPTLDGHAIHGTGLWAEWEELDESRLQLELGPPWPFGGWVEASYRLTDTSLHCSLEVSALDTVMPVMVGWHPWFRRALAGVAAELDLRAGWMAERDERHLPTGRRVTVPPGPWDDCFGDVDQPVTLRWPGMLELRLRSDCSFWVVYDEPEHALCVEPQSALPDAFNHHPDVVAPGEAFARHFELEWTSS